MGCISVVGLGQYFWPTNGTRRRAWAYILMVDWSHNAPTSIYIPYQYYHYHQPNQQLPFLATVDFPNLSWLIKDPIHHDPSWLTIPINLHLDIPKFDGKPSEDLLAEKPDLGQQQKDIPHTQLTAILCMFGVTVSHRIKALLPSWCALRIESLFRYMWQYLLNQIF